MAFNLLSNKKGFKGNILNAPFSKGFILVEILIVIAIIGALTAIAASGISALVETFKFKSTIREIGTTVLVARLKA